MLSVALTGNVASGKSTVAEQWAAVGVPVISADDLSRRAVEPGTPGLHAVVQAFGEQLLKADGTLDRGALGDLVFSDEDARARLESILHPIIWRLRDLWLEERRAEGATLVVSEIPLLFEVDRQGDFDAVVLVDAPDEQRLRRLVESRGIGSDDARRIMAAQMDPAAKRAKADFVIGNDGTPDELRAAAADVLRQLREGRGEDATPRVDLHLHTEGSWDCLSDPEAVLERALVRGLGRIAITDHNQLDVALRMAEAHPDQIIPGEEVKTAEGIDVIVRGLRAGLPVSESIIAVGREMSGPVRDIFATISERLNFGEPIEEAVADSAQSMDTPELKFFGISLSIQRETGGNLSEALENLSDILRRRRQMQLKIKALSSEAKASAIIIGSLPFIMFLILSVVSGDYVQTLFTDPRGMILVGIGLGFMVVGIAVMAKMVRFVV